MFRRLRIFTLVMLWLCVLNVSVALSNFTIKAIKFEGLQRISPNTALDYMPVSVGDEFNEKKSRQIISNLYKSGFFQTIRLAKNGNTLVVIVEERPTIATLVVSGNSEINKEQLDKVLKDNGLVEGQTFDQATLDKFVVGLQTEYERRGKYNAKIDADVQALPRNRVNVTVTISEGKTAVIRQINIVGNTRFNRIRLMAALPMITPNLFSWVTRKDLFNQDRLNETINALTSFYMDRGYIRFKVESTQVALSPDHTDVYLTLKINEGPVYKLSSVQFTGQNILPPDQLKELTKNLKPGATFSRKAVQDTGRAISTALGDKGYAFANINPMPKIDDDTKTVAITYFITPGHLVYVNRILFNGNVKTDDVVFRREMRQPEAAAINVSKIEESTRRLNLLGYVEDVHVDTKPVANSYDQVDLDYSVKELPTAQASLSLGYGTNGLTFNAALNQSDFLGTGKTVGFNFNTGLGGQNYSINYNDPYYTLDGVQRGFNIFYTRSTPGNLHVVNYSTDTYGGNVNFSVPVSENNDSLSVGFGLQNINVNVGNTPSQQLLSFFANNGCAGDSSCAFNQSILTSGWTRNGYNKAFFPTSGLYQSASLEVSGPLAGKTLDYYRLSYHSHLYEPLNRYFIFSAIGNLAYGAGYNTSGELPFFKNFYAGGIGSTTYLGQVRGFETYTLGPLDNDNNPLGGNTLMAGTAAMIFPNPVKNLRSMLFVDAGNVYNTYTNSIHFKDLRYSTGIAFQWQVPVLNVLLDISYAIPLNIQTTDKIQQFQFSIGSNLY